jgi:plasmid stabilization system protein ParE
LGLKVFWTAFAEEQLRNIHSFYSSEASVNIAQNLILGILDASEVLSKNPELGREEHLIKHPSRTFRYLIHKNYKIINWVNAEKKIIEILDVFDTRQNPKKLDRYT